MEKGRTNLMDKLLEINAFNSGSQSGSGSGSGEDLFPPISVTYDSPVKNQLKKIDVSPAKLDDVCPETMSKEAVFATSGPRIASDLGTLTL
jgi:hypothetical protein